MSKKISQFPQKSDRSNDDWLLIEEAVTGVYKRIKVSDFIANLGNGRGNGGSSLLSNYAFSVLQDNPLLFYQLNSRSGNLIKDDSGFSNHGSYSGAVTYNLPTLLPNNSSGGSTFFPGYPTDAVLLCPNSAYLNNLYTTDYSLEVWVKPMNYPPNNVYQDRSYILCKVGYHIGIFYDVVGHFSFNVFRNNGDTRWDSTDTYPLNSVYHIVSTFDWTNNRIKLYVNANKQIDAAIDKSNSIRYNASQWQLGQANPGGQYFQNALSGLVSNIAIYDSILSQSKIGVHYQAGIS